MNLYKFFGGSLTALVLSTGTAWGLDWFEMGDAPDFPIGATQTTVGIGSLDSISGGMIWAPGDHVDAYTIQITSLAQFSASLDPGDGGHFTDDGGFEDDSRLYLFDLAGNMIMANDDKPAASLESFLSDPTTFPGGTTNNPGSATPGTYVLAVTYFSNDLQDPGGTALASFSPFADLHGVNPASTGVPGSWENPGDSDTGWTYTIALTGVTASQVPEPSSILLVSLGLFGLARRRRCR